VVTADAAAVDAAVDADRQLAVPGVAGAGDRGGRVAPGGVTIRSRKGSVTDPPSRTGSVMVPPRTGSVIPPPITPPPPVVAVRTSTVASAG